MNWLKKEDQNTIYFHAVTAERRKRNRIEIIKAKDGIECRSEKEIAVEIAKYFKSLFTTDHPKDFEEILEGIPRTITESMNRNLTKIVKN